MFTWKKGLVEIEERSKSQNRNENRIMKHQKQWSLSPKWPQKIKMKILIQNLSFLSDEKLQKLSFGQLPLEIHSWILGIS